MTIEEAIKHYEEVAAEKEDNAKWNLTPTWQDECKQCAADHRQLAEWLEELRARRYCMEKICAELAKQFDNPCNFSPTDEYMLENGCCNDCHGDIAAKECWQRFFNAKIGGNDGF